MHPSSVMLQRSHASGQAGSSIQGRSKLASKLAKKKTKTFTHAAWTVRFSPEFILCSGVHPLLHFQHGQRVSQVTSQTCVCLDGGGVQILKTQIRTQVWLCLGFVSVPGARRAGELRTPCASLALTVISQWIMNTHTHTHAQSCHWQLFGIFVSALTLSAECSCRPACSNYVPA